LSSLICAVDDQPLIRTFCSLRLFADEDVVRRLAELFAKPLETRRKTRSKKNKEKDSQVQTSQLKSTNWQM